MKTILITTIAAMLTGTAFSQAPASGTPPAPGSETVSQKARNFWIKSKGYLSENETTFKEGAQQTLTDLGKEIDTVSTKAGATPPMYFQTRLQSLKQQHQHLAVMLSGLNGEAVKTRMSGPRYAFDKCVGSLEEAIDQADDEADVLAKIHRPEKK